MERNVFGTGMMVANFRWDGFTAWARERMKIFVKVGGRAGGRTPGALCQVLRRDQQPSWGSLLGAGV